MRLRRCFIALSLLVACGGRSGLLDPYEATTTTSAPHDAGMGRDGARDLIRPDQSPRVLCPDPISWKDPSPVVTYPDRHATAPSLAVVDPGDSTSARPGSVAVQVFASGGSSSAHIAVEVALARVAPPWPTGTTIERAPLLWGVESHGWGEMAPGAAGSATLALAWHSDQGGKGRPVFRTLATAGWTAGPVVEIAATGEAVLDLAAGQGVTASGYGGPGYAVVWRDVLPTSGAAQTRPLVAVLDGAGTVVHGPLEAAAPNGYPGRSPRIVWSGTSYVIATSFSSCVAGDLLCAERSVVVARLANPSTKSPGGLIPTATIPSLSSSTRPRRASAAVHAGQLFVAWAEGGADDASLLTVRLARLSLAGALVAPVVTVAQNARPLSAVSLDATALGLIASWPEEGTLSLPPAKLGYSQIVVHWLDAQGQALHPAARIPSPRYETYGPTSAVAIDHPRGLLLTWGGRLPSGLDGALLAAGLCAP
jgi:hypothetical protein